MQIPVFYRNYRIMIKIINDLYDIAWRLNAIDSDYDLYYNTKKLRFEIWAKNKLQLIVPYKNLDIRTLTLVRQTRIENINKIMEDINNHNKEVEAKQQAKFYDKQNYKAKNLVKYLEKGKDYIPNYDEL